MYVQKDGACGYVGQEGANFKLDGGFVIRAD